MQNEERSQDDSAISKADYLTVASDSPDGLVCIANHAMAGYSDQKAFLQ